MKVTRCRLEDEGRGSPDISRCWRIPKAATRANTSPYFDTSSSISETRARSTETSLSSRSSSAARDQSPSASAARARRVSTSASSCPEPFQLRDAILEGVNFHHLGLERFGPSRPEVKAFDLHRLLAGQPLGYTGNEQLPGRGAAELGWSNPSTWVRSGRGSTSLLTGVDSASCKPSVGAISGGVDHSWLQDSQAGFYRAPSFPVRLGAHARPEERGLCPGFGVAALVLDAAEATAAPQQARGTEGALREVVLVP
ncbi:hypothetical protein GUJ93_ZPchr0010g9340 [Zizania palustris]|uniref:Uncharacterized protein n=1 Tax=Zizania palustris TaxID=103762 RepID=A0A8J5WD22_ZIZPA|nr:hypothetical protein GUJ93_ZPchr0010g9340 [Zizania palustris]